MWKSARVLSLVTLLGAAATASPGVGPDSPEGLQVVVAGGVSLTLWPYTTSDFENPSDPINLIFPSADPREIRRRLFALDGNRPPFATLPGGNCTWTDAMGYEQAAFGQPEGWVGGAVQLACVQAGAPLGSPFRLHIRLFRTGENTLGNAHFEFLIPGTAEHEVLSWDLARELATYDVARTGALTAAPSAVGLVPPGTWRTVRRPVFQALAAAGAGPLLASLGLVLPASGDVPIPTSGQARVLVGALDADQGPGQNPAPTTVTTTTGVTYSIVVPKPFCSTGPFDFVKLEGPLDFSMTVHTDAAGGYHRSYLVGGTLQVTPMTPTSPTTFVPAGDPVEALIFEAHRGMLSRHHGEVTERGAQLLLGDPNQSLSWRFTAGGVDDFARRILCGAE